MNDKYEKILFIIILLIFFVVILIIHKNWLFGLSPLISGDWPYFYINQMKEWYPVHGIWMSYESFGRPIVQGNLTMLFTFFAFLAKLGFSFEIISRLFFFFPICVLPPLASYLFIFDRTKNRLASLLGSVFYSLNTYFIVIQGGHMHISFAYSIAPLCFYFFSKRDSYKIFFGLFLLFIIGLFEIRMALLVGGVAFLIYLFYRSKKISDIFFSFIKISIYLLVFVSLNLFWILPTILIKNSASYNEVFSQKALSWVTFLDAFTLHHPFWSETGVVDFVNVTPQAYMFFVPLLVIIALLLLKNKSKEILFFSVLYLVSFFFIVQENGSFKEIYKSLYNNLPLLSAFRESSKFFIIISFSFSVLIGLFFKHIFLKWNKKLIIIIIFFFCFSILYPIKNYLQGNYIKTFAFVKIPDYINNINNVVDKGESYYRILWISRTHKFASSNSNQPNIGALQLATGNFKNFVSDKNNQFSFLQNEYSNQLLDASCFKYVIIPNPSLEVGDSFKHYDNKPSSDFISLIDKNPNLSLIDVNGISNLLWVNKDYKLHIYSESGLNYYQTNTSEFGDFTKNQNFYLNSDIEKNNYLLNNTANIIAPVEADQNKILEMNLVIDNTEDSKEKKRLQSGLDFYISNSFFKDFKLKIPIKATYEIYFKKDSVLANNKNVSVKIGDQVLAKDKVVVSKNGWEYFNQVDLDEGEYDLKLYTGDVQMDYVNSGDVVFSAEDLVKPIITPKLEYKQVNPTKYIVNVSGASESFPLIFSESFHSKWKIYVQSELISQGEGSFVSENNQGTIQNENLAGGRFYDIFFRKPVLNDKHFVINNFANAWWMDVDVLEQSGIIKKQANGTYDFSVVIEFEPQKYFYVGLGISGITLLGCLGYLGYDWRKKRRLCRQAQLAKTNSKLDDL